MVKIKVQEVLCSVLIILSSVILSLGSSLGQGHRVTSVYEFPDGLGFVAELEVIENTDLYGPDINPLRMTVRIEGDVRVHVQFSDSTNERWKVPVSLIPRNDPSTKKRRFLPQHSSLKLTYTTDPFGFAITRIFNSEVLFNSTPSVTTTTNNRTHVPSFNSMVFKDQYLEISTQLPKSATLFGLGESTRPDGLPLVRGRTYTLWASGVLASEINVDLYGAYPYYLDVRSGGLTHGVLLLNSNGMDIQYGSDYLTWRVIGGNLDFYFFAGHTPLDVMDQYTQLVGRPAPMPYWSFGFHQCRWGYKDVSELRYVVENYKKAKIPLDTMWNDIDYMQNYLDFTLDSVNYPQEELRNFVEELHANGQHYVLILDPGISIAYQNYSTLERGLAENVFLKNEHDDNYLAQVWPGPVYLPDFMDPNATAWWTHEVADFYNKVPFDGLWIDMNEASNFCSGTTCKFAGTVYPDENRCYLDCTSTATKWDLPPYNINHRFGKYTNIGDRTIAMTIKHYDGTLEYNAHNLYGLSESIATNKALRTVQKKRPFILSRSTFVGSGAHAAHWTGDNDASFSNLEYSIASILNSGMVGLPMVGADICGFGGNTTKELCNRWIQLGAFYPFSRSHTIIGSVGQELYLWESVATSARAALGLRYRLLPFFYTLMFESHTKGSPIARPLFFTFPKDPLTLNVSNQFLLGSSVMVSPVVLPKVTSVKAYFPKGTWYNLFDYSKIESPGRYVDLAAPIDRINVHIHEGAIVPMQGNELTSTLVRATPFTLLVSFSDAKASGCARGKLFLDSGDDIEMEIRKGKSTLVKFFGQKSEEKGSLVSKVVSADYALRENWSIETVVILGASRAPTSLTINGKLVPVPSSVSTMFDDAVPSITISHLNLPVGKDFELKWSTQALTTF